MFSMCSLVYLQMFPPLFGQNFSVARGASDSFGKFTEGNIKSFSEAWENANAETKPACYTLSKFFVRKDKPRELKPEK